ncbi:putative N-acetylglucosamine-6-phosphate deacetylase [Cichlidogyrus casuarinus]|uniref:N-acetylglucosamine-6-phosphate deacetylase n=1 Tax=Cichlidogyrus casuarinus TaxID=1844966 RepID=A0ABD2Q965_9PLAT
MLTKFIDCFILKGASLEYDELLVENGVILDPIDVFYRQKRVPQKVISCENAIIAPGFIDIQINGALGIDFSTHDGPLDEKIFCDLASYLLKSGTTSICPTVITSPKSAYPKIWHNLDKFINSFEPIRVLGIHMEGPFLSSDKRGMHPENFIAEFGVDAKKTLLETYGNFFQNIRIVTLAPELDNACQAIEYLTSRQIKVGLGHTAANYDQMLKAFDRGASFITHLFNAMPAFHHRSPSVLGSLIDSEKVYAGIIADKVHSHPKSLKLAERATNGRVILITDGNVAMGLKDGDYKFGDREITVDKSIAYVKGTKTLAGATQPMLKCVEGYWQEACDQTAPFKGLATALLAASTRPAIAISTNPSLDLKIGKITPGYLADFVVLHADLENKRLQLKSTYINGEQKYAQ